MANAAEQTVKREPGRRQIDLAQMRQYFRGAVVDADENSQRLLSLSFGASVAMLLVTAPLLGPALQAIWVGMCLGITGVGFLFRRRWYRSLREWLLDQQLLMHTPLDRELWDRIGNLKPLPAPLGQYVEHVLGTYCDLRDRVNDGTEVELGQVQVLQAKDQVFDFIEQAEKTGDIRQVLETHGHRLSDDDQARLRRMFTEQCAGLHQIAQSFDRGVGNLVVAQILGNELGESGVEHLVERMRMIEDEFEEVKDALAVEL